MRLRLNLKLKSVSGRMLGSGNQFALSDGQWFVTERPEDANTQRVRTDVYAVPPAGKRFIWTRTPNADGIPTISNFGEYTEVSLGHYQSNAVNRTTAAAESVRVFLVDTSVPSPVAWNNPLVTPVSLVRRFQPSGLPFAPTFTYFADGSGTAAQLRLDPRAVNEGNGRNGVTPWRAVDQLRWRIGAGSYTTISDASTIDLTGLSDTQSVGLCAQNVNGWSAETVVTVNAVLPALGSGDWTLVDAGDGANMIATITNAPTSPTGAPPTGYEYTLDAGSTWTALPGGGAIPGSVGSNTVALRVIYDVGRSAASPSKTVSVTAPSAFPGQRSHGQGTSGTGNGRAITLPTHAAGDYIIVAVAVDGTPNVSATAGWTVQRADGTARDPSLYWVYKQAASSGETLTVTTDASEAIAWNAVVEQGVSGIQFGTANPQYGGSSVAIDDTTLTISGGSAKVKYLIAIAGSGATAQQSSAPSGFTLVDTPNNTGTTSGDVGLALAHRDVEAASLDPAAWPTNTRICTSQMIALLPAAGAAVTAPSGLSLAISPESPVAGDTVTYTFTFAGGTVPITTSLTVDGSTTTNSTGIHTRVHAAGTFGYSYSSSNAGGSGPSGSGSLVVSAPATVTASASGSGTPAVGASYAVTVTVSDGTAGLVATRDGAAITGSQLGNVWTFASLSAGAHVFTPTATVDAATVSGTPITFTLAGGGSVVAPLLEGVPETGDNLTLIAGSGVASPTYLIERTDNGGSTYATEKTAVAGEVFPVPVTTGRQYRAVMLNGVTRYVGTWSQPVATGGPQIAVASLDGRTLSVTNPSPGSSLTVRARPYGGGAATTVSGTAATLTLVLTGDGCWQIDQSTDAGATYGALAYRWCQTVGAVSFFGRNASAVGISPGSPEAPVELVMIGGRQATLDRPTPADVVEVISGNTYYTSQCMWNPKAFNSLGPVAWDNRRLTDSSGTLKVATAQSFDPTLRVTNWPIYLTLYGRLSKYLSNPNSLYVGFGQRHRHGLPQQQAALVVDTQLSTTSPYRAAAQVADHSARVDGGVLMPGLAGMISTFQGMTLSTTGMVATDTATMLAKIQRFSPALAFNRGGTHGVNSHETDTPYRMSYPFTFSNYYENKLVSHVIHLLTTNRVDNTWKQDACRALAIWGHQIDVPGNSGRIGAGIAQHHEVLVMFSRIAKGQSFTDIATNQPGNHLSTFHRFTTAELPQMDPHNDQSWPSFSRRRQVTDINVLMKNLTTQLYTDVDTAGDRFAVQWWGNSGENYGDDLKQRFYGLDVVQERTGQRLPFGLRRNGDQTMPNGASGRTKNVFAVDGFFTSPLVVGDWIYLEIPSGPRATIRADGFVDWNYSADKPNLHLYNPTPSQSYRDIEEPHDILWLGHALGIWPTGGAWDLVKEHTLRTFTANWPGTGIWDFSPTCTDFIRNMWDAHRTTLGLTL